MRERERQTEKHAHATRHTATIAKSVVTTFGLNFLTRDKKYRSKKILTN